MNARNFAKIDRCNLYKDTKGSYKQMTLIHLVNRFAVRIGRLHIGIPILFRFDDDVSRISEFNCVPQLVTGNPRARLAGA